LRSASDSSLSLLVLCTSADLAVAALASAKTRRARRWLRGRGAFSAKLYERIMRKQAPIGQATAMSDTTDPVIEAALVAARAVFPEIQSSRQSRGPLHASLDSSVARSPDLLAGFRDAVLADENLADLVNAGAIRYSTGSGGSWHFDALLPGLLRASRDRMNALDEQLTLNQWLVQVRQSIGDLRALTRGERVACPVVVELVGLPLPDDFKLEHADAGVLRPSREYERAMNAYRSDPTAVVQRFEPVGVDFLPPTRPHGITSWIGPDSPHLVAANRICSAAVLAMSPPFPFWFAPTVTAIATIRPLGGRTGASHFYSGLVRSDASAHLTTAVLTELSGWVNLVLARYQPSIDIADERLRSALRRSGTHDGLIDAVIVWENLVGAAGEQRFRISGALAVLLEADPAKRHARQRALAKTYDARSGIVHGQALGPDKVRVACADAIEAGQAALRRLYRDLPELLADPQRGTRLLLGDIGAR
jgi:hypothetical protein